MTRHTEAKPVGIPTWCDLSTPDPAAARDFYAALFGWEHDTNDGYTQTAATGGQVGSCGSGCMARPQSPRTRPGVSAPSNVVRSMHRTVSSNAASCAVPLIERVPRDAARASQPTWSTPGRPCRNRRRVDSEEVTSA